MLQSIRSAGWSGGDCASRTWDERQHEKIPAFRLDVGFGQRNLSFKLRSPNNSARGRVPMFIPFPSVPLHHEIRSQSDSKRTTSAGAIRAVLQSTLQPMALRASSSPPAVAARLRRPPPARLRRHSSPPAGAPLSTIDICLPWVHWVHDEYANTRCQLLRIMAACDEVFGLYGGIGDIPDDVLVHNMWSEIVGVYTDAF